MDSVNKYLKIAKDLVVKPPEDIGEKIIDKISNIGDSDKALLDEKFLDYLKKNNSRLYLLSEKIKNNPGKFAALASTIALVIIFLGFLAVAYCLSSSENSSKDK